MRAPHDASSATATRTALARRWRGAGAGLMRPAEWDDRCMPMTDRRVALVTRSSRGLGAVIARRLAEDGFAVAINGRPPPAPRPHRPAGRTADQRL